MHCCSSSTSYVFDHQFDALQRHVTKGTYILKGADEARHRDIS